MRRSKSRRREREERERRETSETLFGNSNLQDSEQKEQQRNEKETEEETAMKTVKSYHQAARVESDDDDDWTVNPSQTAFEVLYKQERERERERKQLLVALPQAIPTCVGELERLQELDFSHNMSVRS